jgi:hypothetical protein
MSAACKFRPRESGFVCSFTRSGSFPLHLRDAKAFGVKQRQSHRPSANVTLDGAYPGVQGRKMQRIAFAKMIALMVELARFALKSVMNFKILVVIHCLGLWAFGDAG